MRLLIVLVPLLVVGCTNKITSNDTSTSTVIRDVSDYAIASCYSFQDDSFLKDQGDAWASVIIQRMKGDPSALLNIVDLIKNEVGKGDMAVMRNDIDPTQDKTLPVLFCNDIVRKLEVQTEINKSALMLGPSYRD